MRTRAIRNTAPHSVANAASLRRRCGFVPAEIKGCPAVLSHSPFHAPTVTSSSGWPLGGVLSRASVGHRVTTCVVTLSHYQCRTSLRGWCHVFDRSLFHCRGAP